jgi:hypothetical protein
MEEICGIVGGSFQKLRDLETRTGQTDQVNKRDFGTFRAVTVLVEWKTLDSSIVEAKERKDSKSIWNIASNI